MTNKQEPKWRVDPQASAQWTVDPARCAVSGADLTPAGFLPTDTNWSGIQAEARRRVDSAGISDLTQADCGPGVGGAASEPLYEECLAMQGPPEVVVTDEMTAAGRQVAIYEAGSVGDVYRAMAARDPYREGPTALEFYAAQFEKMAARIAELEAAPVELYRADERRIDVWREIVVAKDARIAELKSELATIRVTTQPTSAQTGVGDKDKPSAAPKPMPASALMPKQSDPRRIGG